MTHYDMFGYPTLTPAPDGWGTTITSTAPILDLTHSRCLELSAHHEAAHVAVARDGGCTTGGVTYHGWDTPEAAASVESMAGPRDAVLVSVAAGWRAEVEWFRQEGLWTPEREWVAERRAADGDRDQFDEFTDPASSMTWKSASGQADVALAYLWPEVARMAEVLVSAWSAGRPFVSDEELRETGR